MSLPTSPLRLLPTAATFVGWDSHPLKFRAFSRRTMDGQDEQDENQKARQKHKKTNIRNYETREKYEKYVAEINCNKRQKPQCCTLA